MKTKDSVCKAIRREFKKSDTSYGSPRIYLELKSQGFKVCENTIAAYIREMDLDARLKKKYRAQTTDSNHDGPIAPRLFKVEEEYSLSTEPGKLLAGDITYLRLGQSFLYLAVVLGLYNREVVGWSMSRTMDTNIVLRTLSGAMKNWVLMRKLFFVEIVEANMHRLHTGIL